MNVNMLGLLILLLASGRTALADDGAHCAASAGAKTVVAISDLHLGLGRGADGKWLAYEDFRWPHALAGFLERLGQDYGDKVDLLVLGDLLELWQPYDGLNCDPPGANFGCTPEQIEKLVERVVSSHQGELKALGMFAAKGDNRLIIVPGNHDAALLLPGPQKRVLDIIGQPNTRAWVQTTGRWQSCDGTLAAEHGHQIGKDVNAFDHWPEITAREGDTVYLQRPWGEQFVQTLFNDTEQAYPIIDNLSPESAGAAYRLKNRGAARSAVDVAKFVAFNLFQTSLRQKANVLGESSLENTDWDIRVGRELGFRLVVFALPSEGSFSAELKGANEADSSLALALTAYVKQADDDTVKQLCELAALRTGKPQCVPAKLGALTETLLSTRKHVLTTHIEKLMAVQPKLHFFIYGHTHEVEMPWVVPIGNRWDVQIANTGAFQRVVDEEDFLRIAKDKKLTGDEAIAKLTNEDLPPCYSYVVATGSPMALRTFFWRQDEMGAGERLESTGKCYRPSGSAQANTPPNIAQWRTGLPR